MSIKVIEQSTEERENELKCLFDKMKPLLLDGKSYSQALSIIKGTNSKYTHTRWYKDLVKYGESQGFNKEDFEYSNKYGLLNIQLCRYDVSLTGYYWTYTYFDEFFKKRRMMDCDLSVLKRKVLDKGLSWRVLNEFKADKSFKLNERLLANKRPSKSSSKGKRSTSGVKYVSKVKNVQSRKGYYWSYKRGNDCVMATSLRKLKMKMDLRGWEWIIVEDVIYFNNIIEDK